MKNKTLGKTWSPDHRQNYLTDNQVSKPVKELIKKFPEAMSVEDMERFFWQAVDIYQKNKIDIQEMSDLCEFLMGFCDIYVLLEKKHTDLIIHLADVNWYFENGKEESSFVSSISNDIRELKIPKQFL